MILPLHHRHRWWATREGCWREASVASDRILDKTQSNTKSSEQQKCETMCQISVNLWSTVQQYLLADSSLVERHFPGNYTIALAMSIVSLIVLFPYRRQLFGAYYDVRKNSKIGPAVRILGMIDRINPTVKTFCQFWFDGQKEPFIVKTFEYKYMWFSKWGNFIQGNFQPYLIACQIPKPFQALVPASVSIVEKQCDTATNNLKVIYNLPADDRKKGFAVCVKGLDFLYDDLSVKLVEWIELITLLGADKIYFYELQVHPVSYIHHWLNLWGLIRGHCYISSTEHF